MNILWQTACMAVNQIMIDDFASRFNCTMVGCSSDWMAVPSSIYFSKLTGVWISTTVVGPIVVLFVVFLSSQKHAYIILTPLNPTFI